MSKFITGNWKMNGSKDDLDKWFWDFFENELNNDNTVLICVPSIYVDYANKLAKKYYNNRVFVGCQDVHQEEKGAYTGNTSTVFLNELGIKYTIIGHSERRMYEGETDELVSKKALDCIKHSITPIICVGETLDIREADKYKGFIRKSVIESTKGLDVKKIIVAYEPVWAIGTGKIPTINEIEEIGILIKDILSNNVRVLYGGSVKLSNSKEILSIKSIDGVLVGGASLKGSEFYEIANYKE